MNLGNPVETSVAELAQLIIELTGSRSNIVHRPLPVDDPDPALPRHFPGEDAARMAAANPAAPGPRTHDRLFRPAVGRARRDGERKAALA